MLLVIETLTYLFVRFEIFTGVVLKIQFSWDVTHHQWVSGS